MRVLKDFHFTFIIKHLLFADSGKKKLITIIMTLSIRHFWPNSLISQMRRNKRSLQCNIYEEKINIFCFLFLPPKQLLILDGYYPLWPPFNISYEYLTTTTTHNIRNSFTHFQCSNARTIIKLLSQSNSVKCLEIC